MAEDGDRLRKRIVELLLIQAEKVINSELDHLAMQRMTLREYRRLASYKLTTSLTISEFVDSEIQELIDEWVDELSMSGGSRVFYVRDAPEGR